MPIEDSAQVSSQTLAPSTPASSNNATLPAAVFPSTMNSLGSTPNPHLDPALFGSSDLQISGQESSHQESNTVIINCFTDSPETIYPDPLLLASPPPQTQYMLELQRNNPEVASMLQGWVSIILGLSRSSDYVTQCFHNAQQLEDLGRCRRFATEFGVNAESIASVHLTRRSSFVLPGISTTTTTNPVKDDGDKGFCRQLLAAPGGSTAIVFQMGVIGGGHNGAIARDLAWKARHLNIVLAVCVPLGYSTPGKDRLWIGTSTANFLFVSLQDMARLEPRSQHARYLLSLLQEAVIARTLPVTVQSGRNQVYPAPKKRRPLPHLQPSGRQQSHLPPKAPPRSCFSRKERLTDGP
jgi:hypothetical protein